jgi:hypothetical protein
MISFIPESRRENLPQLKTKALGGRESKICPDHERDGGDQIAQNPR